MSVFFMLLCVCLSSSFSRTVCFGDSEFPKSLKSKSFFFLERSHSGWTPSWPIVPTFWEWLWENQITRNVYGGVLIFLCAMTFSFISTCKEIVQQRHVLPFRSFGNSKNLRCLSLADVHHKSKINETITRGPSLSWPGNCSRRLPMYVYAHVYW